MNILSSEQQDLVTPEHLSECYTYDDETGLLRWNVRPLSHFVNESKARAINKAKAGRLVSVKINKQGYQVINVGRKQRTLHRILWIMLRGPIPEGHMVDHINGNGLDNRIANLRLADPYQNAQNTIRHRSLKYGLRGVRKKGCKWYSYLHVNGRYRYLGIHITKGLAAVAYAKASLRYHGKYSQFLRMKLSDLSPQ